LKPLTAAHGEALLTSYLAAFPAKTSASPERGRASTAPAAASGATWRELSAKFDRSSCSWKTHRLLFDEDLPESSVTLPRSGMMLDGILWERTTSAHPTKGTGSGSSRMMWQTPTVSMAEHSGQIAHKEGQQLRLAQQVNNRHLRPTPSATDGNRGGKITPNMTGQSLPQMVNTRVMFPTSTATQRGDCPAERRRKSPCLESVVKFPTPTCPRPHDSESTAGKFISTQSQKDLTVVAKAGGQLNPDWVEWLMGWPIGWTALEPLATDKFQQWLDSQ